MKRNSRQIVVTFSTIQKDIKEGLKYCQDEFNQYIDSFNKNSYLKVSGIKGGIKRVLNNIIKEFLKSLDIVSQNSWEQDLKKLRRENIAILKKADKLKGKTVKKSRGK